MRQIRGFSVIELLVAIGILAVLAAIASTRVGDAWRKADLRQFAGEFNAWVQRVKGAQGSDLDLSRLALAEVMAAGPTAWPVAVASPTTTRVHPLGGQVAIAFVANNGIANAAVQFTISGISMRQCVEAALATEVPFQTLWMNGVQIKTGSRNPVDRATLVAQCTLAGNTLTALLT